jgi:hypothetical protein
MWKCQRVETWAGEGLVEVESSVPPYYQYGRMIGDTAALLLTKPRQGINGFAKKYAVTCASKIVDGFGSWTAMLVWTIIARECHHSILEQLFPSQ